MLAGPFPRMIDEWQLVPKLWNVVSHTVDNNPELGKFIFTGSALPLDKYASQRKAALHGLECDQ